LRTPSSSSTCMYSNEQQVPFLSNLVHISGI
jgi:hypothetical protein